MWQEVHELLGRVVGVLGDRAGVLDEQGLRRDDVVDVLALLLGEDRLVLVGEEDVALAAVDERRGGLTAGAGQVDGVLEQLGDVLLRLGVGAAVGEHVAPGRRGCSTARSRTRPGSG